MEKLDYDSDSPEKDSKETEEPNYLYLLPINHDSDAPQKLPYPKRIFFIISNEFCERFNFYGMRTILVFYLKDKLKYEKTRAEVIFHAFIMCVYFMCVFGGIISDVWLGKFNTILLLSIVYSIGSIIISVGATHLIDINPAITLFIGLFLIAFGSGGIKPCVSSFGGDQFKLPEQAAQIATFFSLFYFTINFGSLISTVATPELRTVECFKEKDCYSLAFGVPAILMVISVVLILIGKPTYTYVKTSSENMIVRVTKCISHAISTKCRHGNTNPRQNLLDYSIDEYGYELVNDIRIVGRIFILFLPLTIFWALFDQQGSTWTLQAEEMNGNISIGSNSTYVVKADQLQALNPVLILVSIPLFDYVLYPLLKKIGIQDPIEKLMIGGCLAGLAFMISAALEFKISSSEEKISMFWQIPQYVTITFSEVMVSVTGLAFSYDQAPKRMKSVVTSIWLLTVAFGNLIVIFIKGIKFFHVKYELLLFGALMFLDMGVFAFLAYRYKRSNLPKIDSKRKTTEYDINPIYFINPPEDGSKL